MLDRVFPYAGIIQTGSMGLRLSADSQPVIQAPLEAIIAEVVPN